MITIMREQENILNEMNKIDLRVKSLEKENDRHAAKHGEFSQIIYDTINILMDRRDVLFKRLHTLN